MIGENQNSEQQPQPKCPHCDAQPVLYNFQPGQTPDGGYFVVQAYCSACNCLLSVQIFPQKLMEALGRLSDVPGPSRGPRIIPPA